VDLLAPGVFFTGMVKDFFCLPRPLSPPLQRITMSGLTALEYGFPSTHSANAVSVALFCLSAIEKSDTGFTPMGKIGLQCLAWIYAASVVMGRIYCGMHGFLGTLFSSNLT
jgi:dihydrosphingosine 1-phosphate phosphatase